MDTHGIWKNAGIVWRVINDSRTLSYEELKQASRLPDRELNAAIGWLARENKIEIEYDGKRRTEIFHPPHCDLYF